MSCNVGFHGDMFLILRLIYLPGKENKFMEFLLLFRYSSAPFPLLFLSTEFLDIKVERQFFKSQ
jgi:hypothetical protein